MLAHKSDDPFTFYLNCMLKDYKATLDIPLEGNKIHSRFDTLSCVVLIPTYNNEDTIEAVIKDVLKYTTNIIVVNDGSTDQTHHILKKYTDILVHSYTRNKGKGYALKKGFQLALEKSYSYVISIDSDGQHKAKDLPVFLDAIEESPETLWVGSRRMKGLEHVPNKSNFGKSFSNFWYWFETGNKLEDTQSGYRLYPISAMKDIRFFSNKFEFEVEVLVRSSWSGIPVKSVSVEVYYPPKEERVSHFRPLKDFTRISILNTLLVFWMFVYIKPRDFFTYIKNKSLKESLKNIFMKPNESNLTKSLSIAWGVFMGIVPLWGYQLIIAIAGAHLMKLNKGITIIAANISIPPMIPLIIYGSLLLGANVLGTDLLIDFSFDSMSISTANTQLKQYIVGSLSLATLASSVLGLISYFAFYMFKKLK